MRDRLENSIDLEAIDKNQTSTLIREYKKHFPGSIDEAQVLDRVAIITPEHIHINSFMYEPIIDMGDDHLRGLLVDVRKMG